VFEVTSKLISVRTFSFSFGSEKFLSNQWPKLHRFFSKNGRAGLTHLPRCNCHLCFEQVLMMRFHFEKFIWIKEHKQDSEQSWR
jgi:hypothetical protein